MEPKIEARHPEYVYSRGKRFISSWAERDLRRDLAHYRKALEEIALEEDNEQAAAMARQALLDIEEAESALDDWQN